MTTQSCESCGMPIDNGCYCSHCVDANGRLQDFDVRFERMVQWALREDGTLQRDAAEQRTLRYMSTMPAWVDHPRIKAQLAA